MGYKQISKLSRYELRELGRAAMDLISVHESLQRTNWAGAQTSAQIVSHAIEAITRIYVKRRHFLPEVIAEMEAAEQSSRQPEPGAGQGDAQNLEHDRTRDEV